MNNCDRAQNDITTAAACGGEEITPEQGSWIAKIVEVCNGICDDCRLYSAYIN